MLCPQAAGVRIGLIFNPTAQGDKARFLQQQLDGIRGECVLMPTEGPGHAEVLAEEAVADGCEVVVAAGGGGESAGEEMATEMAEAPAVTAPATETADVLLA